MPPPLVITDPKYTNGLVCHDHIPAGTASTAGQLMLPEDAAFYEQLTLITLAITGLYSFVLGHTKFSRTHTIPPPSEKTHDYSIKDRVRSEFSRPDSRLRGPSKPAIQVQGIPSYLEKLAHSPTEERTSDVFGASTNTSAQSAETRGRTDAVTQTSTTDRPVLDSSAQSTTSKSQLRKTIARTSPRKIPYPRRVHTDPCATIIECVTRPPEPENTLLCSLRGFQLRPVMPVPSALTHVLGVGLSWSWDPLPERRLPGPAHDLRWLEKLFVDQKQVHFTSLLDKAVSFNAIRQSVTQMYSNARPNDCLVLYFTGHGDTMNAFELYRDDAGSLDEVILNDWIVELRRQTLKRIPVYIIFDFCRENPAHSAAQLDKGVTVIWSCPPGQKSPDMRLSEDLPYSCFLLALFLTIYDGSQCHVPLSAQHFARRLVELINVLWGIRSYRPNSWRRKRWCRHPNSCETCRDKRRNSRNDGGWPDPRLFEVLANMHLGELPDFSMVVRYASTRLPLPIRKVHELLEANPWYIYFNPSRIDTNKGSSTPGIRKFRSRGVRDILESTAQARGRTLPLGALSTPPASISK